MVARFNNVITHEASWNFKYNNCLEKVLNNNKKSTSSPSALDLRHYHYKAPVQLIGSSHKRVPIGSGTVHNTDFNRLTQKIY